MNTAQLNAFIVAINKKYLNGKKEKELQDLWNVISFVPKCKAIVKAGPREGLECGKSCVKDQPHCLCHMPRAESKKKNECNAVLTAGVRKGEVCLKPCEGETCAFHAKERVPCAFVLTEGKRSGVTCGRNSTHYESGVGFCKKHGMVEASEQKEATQVVVPPIQIPNPTPNAALDVLSSKSSNTATTLTWDHVETHASPIAAPPPLESIESIESIENETDSATVSTVQTVTEPEIRTCGSVLKSGPNKGRMCVKKCVEGKNTCATHK